MTDLALAPEAESDEIARLRDEVRELSGAYLKRQHRRERIVWRACGTAVVLALAPLVAIVAYTVVRGIGAWSATFFTGEPAPMGVSGGGIANAIVGSAIIVGLASAVAVPAGIIAALVIARSSGRLASATRFAVDVMAGVPAVTLGIFSYALLVRTMDHFSGISASFALSLFMLPTVIRTTEAAVRAVPELEVQAARALGARRVVVLWRVVLRGALPGLATGVLLAVANALGETSPLLFTAIGSQSLSVSPFGPMAALPLVIYQDGIEGIPSLQRIAWGTSLALLVIVVGLSALGRGAARRIAASKRRASIPSPVPADGHGGPSALYGRRPR